MRPHWHDSEGGALCEYCAPPDMEGDLNSNEVDAPENCWRCGRPCEYTLTADGVEYVLECLEFSIATWPNGAETTLCGLGYYRNLPSFHVERDWAQDLYANYALDKHARMLVSSFLGLTDNYEKAQPPASRSTPPVDRFARRRRTVMDLDRRLQLVDGVEANPQSA